MRNGEELKNLYGKSTTEIEFAVASRGNPMDSKSKNEMGAIL